MTHRHIRSILKQSNPGKAYQFYKKFIFNDEKLKLFEMHGFEKIGSVPPIDWELFASILINEGASKGHGADLINFEVKSAKIGSSFEYQYHKFTGLKKLQEDMKVNHLFISYSESYEEVIVRILIPSQVEKVFKAWKGELKKNYEDGSDKQRFRKSVSFGFVRDNAEVIFYIEKGKLKEL